MSQQTFKKLEIVGTSTVSIDDAINNAISQTASTVRGLRWFEVVETRGTIEKDAVSLWQVTVKIGFTID